MPTVDAGTMPVAGRYIHQAYFRFVDGISKESIRLYMHQVQELKRAITDEFGRPIIKAISVQPLSDLGKYENDGFCPSSDTKYTHVLVAEFSTKAECENYKCHDAHVHFVRQQVGSVIYFQQQQDIFDPGYYVSIATPIDQLSKAQCVAFYNALTAVDCAVTKSEKTINLRALHLRMSLLQLIRASAAPPMVRQKSPPKRLQVIMLKGDNYDCHYADSDVHFFNDTLHKLEDAFKEKRDD